MIIRALFFISILALVLFSCKVKQPLSSAPQSKTATDTLDPVNSPLPPTAEDPLKEFYITQLGDTLESLGEEVAIDISRLLPDTISIAAVGDIMMGTNYPKPSYLPPYNGELLWNETREQLAKADITFGNLEGTMFDGEGDPKDCKNPESCYLFRMPSSLSKNLISAGFDLLSVANNHANDFGKEGRLGTQSILDSLNIAYSGSIERPYTVTKMGHVKIGFVAFAPNKGTLLFYDTAKANTIIKELNEKSDIVIVSIHGGAEGSKNMHVTRKREFYYGEDRGNIYEFSHALIDHGADLILGHGPHVPRAIEVYKKKLIAYSLGNFCTYGRFNLRGASGEAPLLETKINVQGEFIEGQIISFRQSYSAGPMIDESMMAARTIRRLSQEDFPKNEITIDEKGKITYIQN